MDVGAVALALISLLLSPFSFAKPVVSLSKRCIAAINSLDDVAAAATCTTVVINAFTVPAGLGFNLNLASGTTIEMNGTVMFGVANWAGPLFLVKGKNITWNGNGNAFDGQGASYWDGQGLSGGVTKPAPMLKIFALTVNFSTVTNTLLQNVVVLNTPARGISVESSITVLSYITVDNSAGAALGKNTDCFDVSSSNLVIEHSYSYSTDAITYSAYVDDCLAVNKGSNITFQRNTCSGGQGISVGSITSDVIVSNVTIYQNTITNSQQALRIKTDAVATNSTVANITYTGNKGSYICEYGVIIDQSYPAVLGVPVTGVAISGIAFIRSENTIRVNSTANRLEINCGSPASCPGLWNFEDLEIYGGEAGSIANATARGGQF